MPLSVDHPGKRRGRIERMTAENKDSFGLRDRKARLAAELRANLLKRKAQARQRKVSEKTPAETDKRK